MSFQYRPLAAIFTACVAWSASAGAGELVDMVRELNTYQYRMVLGGESARADVARQMATIEKALSTIPAEQLKEDKNAFAAAIYLLGGGVAHGAQVLADEQAFSPKSGALISGSLAYAEGRTKDAIKLLGPLDARAYPANLASYLSLVQGGLEMGTNAQEARAHLRFARLEAPDSLVEEAALRRELILLEPLAQFNEMVTLGRRYSAKYAKSPFAARFWNVLSDAATDNALILDHAQLAMLEELLVSMAPRDRSAMHLEIARKAILNSELEMARAEIEKAQSVEKGEAERRIKFYRLLVEAVSGASVDAMTKALTRDGGALTDSDKELGKIALDGLRALEAANEKAEAAKPAAQVADNDEAILASSDSPLPNAIIEALAKSSETLERAARQ